MLEDLPLERCYKIILFCIDVLEKSCDSPNGTVNKSDVPEWNNLFGEKETTISVLTKLVAMQKTVMELMQRQKEQQEEQTQATALTQEDWELLALCVDRWRQGRGAPTAL